MWLYIRVHRLLLLQLLHESKTSSFETPSCDFIFAFIDFFYYNYCMNRKLLRSKHRHVTLYSRSSTSFTTTIAWIENFFVRNTFMLLYFAIIDFFVRNTFMRLDFRYCWLPLLKPLNESKTFSFETHWCDLVFAIIGFLYLNYWMNRKLLRSKHIHVTLLSASSTSSFETYLCELISTIIDFLYYNHFINRALLRLVWNTFMWLYFRYHLLLRSKNIHMALLSLLSTSYTSSKHIHVTLFSLSFTSFSTTIAWIKNFFVRKTFMWLNFRYHLLLRSKHICVTVFSLSSTSLCETHSCDFIFAFIYFFVLNKFMWLYIC